MSVHAFASTERINLSEPSGGRQQISLQGAPAGVRIELVDGVRSLGVVAVDSSGKAQLTIGALPSGPHTVRAVKWGTGETAVEPLQITVPARPASRPAFAATYAAGIPADVLATGDLHGDGSQDLILGGPDGIGVIHNGAAHVLKGTLPSAPTAIAVIDLNGDGLNDLAIACAGGRVAILLNRGNHSFSPVQDYAAGAHPSAIAAADFNGDGISDLAIADQDGNELAILYGKGDGTFASAVSIPAGYSPRALVAADFNGDGIPDLAAANFSTNDISILLGDGHGGFRLAGVFAAGSGPSSLAAADFNEDGFPDLVALNQLDGTVSVLLNDGAGSFRDPVEISGASAVAAGDVDGDGHIDLVLHTGDQIEVRWGAGDGTFGSGSPLRTAAPPLLLSLQGREIAAVGPGGAVTLLSGRETSIDADATRPDGSFPMVGASAKGTPHLEPLASFSSTTLSTSSNPVVFGQSLTLTANVSPTNATNRVTFFDGTTLLGTRFLSNGQATLTTNMLPSNARSLKAYYGGDGNFTSSSSGAVVELVNTQSAGGFQTAASYTLGNAPYAAAVADLNGDGKADLTVVSPGSSPNYAGSVSVFLGNGDGTFQSPSTYSTGTGSSHITIADVNGDSVPDLVIANWGGSVNVLRGNGNGTFQAARTYDVGGSPYCLAVADFNGDGNADIAVATNDSNQVILLLGSPTGDFTAGPTFFASNAPEAIIAGDFNGDGLADLAIAGSNGVSVMLGTGNANFRPPVVYAAGATPYSITSGDFNGDGKPDLAVANLDGGNVSVLMGNGDGTFGGPVNYTAGPNAEFVSVGDFNGDGNADLAVANFGPTSGSGGNVSVLYGNGNGTFQSAQNYTAGATPFFVAVGNLNGDGRPDLVAVDLNGFGVDILLGSGALPPSVHIDTPAAGALAGSGSISVTGWAIDNTVAIGSAIANVVVKVDGNVAGNATYGISRVDVCGVFPGRAGCPNVGFSYSLNTNGLATGTHTLTVAASNSDAVPDTGTASVTFTVSNVAPVVHIDTPAQGTVLTSGVTLTGWAIDSSSTGTAISSVQVKVDGNVVGNATYGVSRIDVCTVFPGRPGCPNVGYSFQLSALAAGTHTITVSATDSDATPDTGTASVTVSVLNSPPGVVIDTPAANSVLSGTAMVTGWALDNTASVGPAIASVVVKVDGNAVGNATYGVSRIDVCLAYPGRAGCPNVGYSFALDTTGFTPGGHTLTVVATAADGSTGSASAPFQVSPAPSVFIDSIPSGGKISGMVTVSGWALDNTTTIGTAISFVQVQVDGNFSGYAAYGLPRADVCLAYPGRPGCPNVGFTYQLNADKLSPGTHVITVLAPDSDPTPDTGSFSLSVTK